ncbi:hypothetical protein NLY39_01805 [Pseudomonas sp. KHPS1]|nr:hypothetical protein [Pseudomonas sp. KHPS1]UTH36912.1 hypothetical protein NLY39_01805 [Pseudomonas sp. KHPS1]
MTFKRLLPLALLTGLHAAPALASSDMTCAPSWKLISDQLSGCNNLAFLSPGNDSRVNLQLLLDDAGHLKLTREPLALDGYEYGYGLVPFSLGMLDASRARGEAAEADEQGVDPDLAYLTQALQRLGIDSEADALAVQRFAEGEGNRCRSNDLQAMRGFVDALGATPDLAASEAQALARSRRSLLSLCGEGDPQAEDILPPATQLQSPAAQAFGDYLHGADAFYRGHFDHARERFAKLASSEQPWLRETAQYLLGRVALNQAQLNAFDEYGFFSPEQVDKTSLDASAKAFEQYLSNYPQGLYSDSARGLQRRVYWLAGDTRRFAEAFARQFERGAQQVDMPALIEELDGKLLPSLAPDAIEDPLLLAMLDLIQLRDPGANREPRLTLEQLQAQQPRFASQPGLHAYLVAAWHFYRGGDAQQALAALPDAGSEPMNALAFSQETLRGLALEAKGENAAALQHWQALLARSQDPLQRAQLQLALALNHERSGQLEKVFAADSPISTAPIRERLLAYGAGPELLRQQAGDEQAPAGERATALYTLLYRDLDYGRYADFLRDFAQFPYKPTQPAQRLDPGLFAWSGGSDAGYACPSLVRIAERLAANAEDAQGMLCLGDFIRVHGLDEHWLNRPPAAGELGSAPSQFQGASFSRLAAYQLLLTGPQVSREDKAYALFRAINCYAPSGYNSCDGQDISKDQRKQWFQTLKRSYADTQWAQRLKYYW